MYNHKFSEPRYGRNTSEPVTHHPYSYPVPAPYPYTQEYSLFEAKTLLLGGPALDRKQKELDEKAFILLKMHHSYCQISKRIHERRSKEEWFYALFYCFTSHGMRADMQAITSALANSYLCVIPEANSTSALNSIPEEEQDKYVILPMNHQDIHAVQYVKTTFDILNTMHTSTDGALTNELCIYQQYLILVSIGREPFIQRKIMELQKKESYSSPKSMADIEDRINNLFQFLKDYVEHTITTIKFNKNNSHEHIRQFVTQCIAIYERHQLMAKKSSTL